MLHVLYVCKYNCKQYVYGTLKKEHSIVNAIIMKFGSYLNVYEAYSYEAYYATLQSIAVQNYKACYTKIQCQLQYSNYIAIYQISRFNISCSN